MADEAERWVAKVHPLTREAEADDPMELIATPAEGDPAEMLECLVQEFVWMGHDAEGLLALFRSPAYPVLNQLLVCLGEEVVRQRIESLAGQTAGFTVREQFSDDPDEEEEPELIQLTVRGLQGEQGPCE